MIDSSNIQHMINMCYAQMKYGGEITKKNVVLEFEALMLAHIKELFDKTIPNDTSDIAMMKREGFVKAMKEYMALERDFTIKYPLHQL